MRGVGLRLRRFDPRLPLVAALLYGGLWPLMNVCVHRALFPAALSGRQGLLSPVFAPSSAGRFSIWRASSVSPTRDTGPACWPSRSWPLPPGRSRAAFCAVSRRDRCDWPAAAFPIIVLTLASRDFGVLFILPMVAGLAAAWLYMALCDKPPNGWAQSAVAGLFLIASIPLYCLLASGFLYLCAMCALFELLVRKRPVWCLAWIAFGAAVPYGVSYVFYEPDIAGRYLRWMRMPQRDAITNGLVAAMYLFIPVGAVVAFLTGRFRIGARLTPRSPAHRSGRRICGARRAGLAAGRAAFRQVGMALRGLPA